MNKQHQVQILKRASVVLLFISLILVLLAVSQDNFLWLVAFIPILLVLSMVPVIAHNLIDSAQPKLKEKTRRILYFTLYNSLATAAAFFILLGLKLEGTLKAGWGYVYIPLWYGLGIYFGFMFFLLPGMLEKTVDMKRQAAMIVLWFFATTLSSIFHVLYLETSFPTELCIVLSPMLISGVIHLVFFIIPIIQAKMNPKLPKINPVGVDLLWIGFIIPTIMITLIKVMVANIIPIFVPFLPIVKILVFLTIQSEKNYVKVKKEGYQYIDM